MLTPIRFGDLAHSLGLTTLIALCGTSILIYVGSRKFESSEARALVARTIFHTALTFCIVLGAIAWIWANYSQDRLMNNLENGYGGHSPDFPAVPLIWIFMYFPLIAPVVDGVAMRRRPNTRTLPIFSILWTLLLITLLFTIGI